MDRSFWTAPRSRPALHPGAPGAAGARPGYFQPARLREWLARARRPPAQVAVGRSSAGRGSSASRCRASWAGAASASWER